MISLQSYSTFRIADVHAKDLITISSPEEAKALSDHPLFNKYTNKLIIGGGSNIVFTQDYDGLVIANELKGRTIVKELNNSIILAIASGENWNDTVMRSVEQWYAGLENLVAIPGTVWAAPVQNIGAYGTEARDIILEVRGIDLTTGLEKTYTNEQCEFWYRESIFKHSLKETFFITEVVIQLIKANERIYHPKLQYAGVQEELLHQWRDGGSYITPLQVANAIATIRASKLPDWTKIGTCGSFFANPIITATQYEELKKDFPDLIGHPTWSSKLASSWATWNGVEGSHPSKSIKLSAGQLIELCGLKWYRDGDAGVYDRHALVLVNYGNATGAQIKGLIMMIQSKVQEKFGIKIVPEVNVM
jgi:UDP-N-acetylmuramate dehydrogenase